jgi:protein ImuB
MPAHMNACPERIAARSGAMQTRDPGGFHEPGSRISGAPFHAAPRPGHAQDSLAPTRPIRLFARPEPVEAVAEVPDGPPVQFTWRRMRHVVARAEGPERIAMEWWRDEAGIKLTRDYFRVESQEGVRVWLYREGLVRSGESTRWFLHGVFA